MVDDALNQNQELAKEVEDTRKDLEQMCTAAAEDSTQKMVKGARAE